MTIYLMMNGGKPVRSFKNIELAKQHLDAQMFHLCKLGNRIESFRDGEYIYSHPKDSTKYILHLTEVELQE